VFTSLANAAGIPAISLPCGPSSGGLPIGFQLIAAFGADERLLQLAAQYEEAHPWADRWPKLLD
jgi:aspartyl-tRNA(Asn)/glutamyl-tRNA(Gln) amidotransferase subunit A